MKTKITTTFLTAIALATLFSVSAFAAPKTMPDGGLFDAAYYAEQNPDVAQAIGTKEADLYNHYLKYGKAEGRLPYNPADVATTTASTATATASATTTVNVTNAVPATTTQPATTAATTTTAAATTATTEKESTYVLNTNSKKFHKAGCKSVAKMSAKNKKTMTATRDEIIGMGYDPCKNCNP